MPAEIRKTLLHVEETLIEGGKAAEQPLKMIAAVAVIKNPWAGQGLSRICARQSTTARQVSGRS